MCQPANSSPRWVAGTPTCGKAPPSIEIDEAVSDRPVFLLQTFNGPSVTSSAGKAFFEREPNAVVVADNGAIAGGMPSTTALFRLRQQQTLESKMQGTVDAWRYSAGLGLTAHLDQVGLGVPGPIAPSQSLAAFDPYRMCDAWQELPDRAGRSSGCRPFLGQSERSAAADAARTAEDQFPFFGSDMLMTGGIGESAAPGDGVGEVWLAAQKLVAEARWRSRATLTLANLERGGRIRESACRVSHHRSRWVISHMPFATPDLLNRLKKIGAAVQLTGWRLQGSATNNGSPFRMVLKNGIRAGLHSDSAHISPLNPWLHLYYATTGVNAAGESINGDQRISGQDALRLYAGERMVPADGAETRRDRGREAGRPGRPERRLRRARRSDQKNPVGDDGCRWKNRSRCGRAEVACSNDGHSFDEGAHWTQGTQ